MRRIPTVEAAGPRRRPLWPWVLGFGLCAPFVFGLGFLIVALVMAPPAPHRAPPPAQAPRSREEVQAPKSKQEEARYKSRAELKQLLLRLSPEDVEAEIGPPDDTQNIGHQWYWYYQAGVDPVTGKLSRAQLIFKVGRDPKANKPCWVLQEINFY